MKEEWCLIVIFFLICMESCSSFVQTQPLLDYENICRHHFSQGCPVHEGDSWKCAKVLTNCSEDKAIRYHCVLNSTGQPFEVIHVCAPLSKCDKGKIPIYDKRKDVISCKPCRNGYYQPFDTWSDETPECLQKHKCEEEGNKIECDMGTGLSKTQDVHCRCDARNNYILTNFEIRGKCVEWAHATCYFHPCPDGQERLLNYSCASVCPKGQKRDDNDICILISLVTQTTASFNDSMIMSGEATPKTTVTVTITLPTISKQPTRDSNIATTIASIIAGVVFLILVILVIVSLKYKVYEKIWCCMRSGVNRRQSPGDAVEVTELENITHDANQNGTARRDACREMTNKGIPVVHHHHHHHEKKIYVKAGIVQVGDNSRIKSFKVPAEQPKTHEDSSLSSSRHSSDLQLADSPPLHNSSQGELPVDRNFSEDIESDTQPKQISNGTDTSEGHASSEETCSKVVE